MLIHNKDDIEFVTKFPCLLGHPVHTVKFALALLKRIIPALQLIVFIDVPCH